MPMAPIHLLLAAVLSTATEDFCSKCHNTGAIENPIAVKQAKELTEYGLDTEPLLHVSWYIEADKKGRSLPSLPCNRCKAPGVTAQARAELERLAAEKVAWLEQRKEVDELCRPRDKLAHVETEHFRLVFGLRKITLKSKKTLNTRKAALLYAKRLEDYYDWFQEYLGYTDEKARVTKHDVYLMGDLRTLMKVAAEYCNLPTDRAARAVGDPSILTTWPEPGVYNRDADFHRHVVYHVSHLLLGVYHLKEWLVEHAGWLEEGIAHMSEMELFRMAGNSSAQERIEEDRADDDWEPVVRSLVAKNKLVPFPELISRRADQLSQREHQLAWSYTDFLYKEYGMEKVLAMVRDMKEKRDRAQLRESLRTHFDLTVTGIEEKWIAWVRENYRAKP